MINDGALRGRQVHYFQETGSTNDLAREAALSDGEPDVLFIAESQSKGRGRLNRTWFSPPGTGLYFSLILSPALDLRDYPKLTLAAGVALCRSLKGYVANPGLKWPNDLLLAGKKTAGILSETVRGKKSTPLVILGIGININEPGRKFPAELAEQINTVEAVCGRPLPRGELLDRVLLNIDDLLNLIEKHGFDPVLDEWRHYDICKGRTLTWLTTEGQTVKGLSLGIDNQGLLKIRDREGVVHEVASGDIITRPV